MATIPDTALDSFRARLFGRATIQDAALDTFPASLFCPTKWFHRNIVLPDTDLVPDKSWEPDEASISLHGRDLRHAVLDRSDLHRADFTGSDLSHASARGARLEKAKFLCIDPDEAWWRSKGCALLKDADFKKSSLQGADLRMARLQGADFLAASLQGADMRQAGIWQTSAPLKDQKEFAPLFPPSRPEPPTTEELRESKEMLEAIAADKLRQQVEKRLAKLFDTEKSKAWRTDAPTDYKFWTELAHQPNPNPGELGTFLASLACSDKSKKGYLAQGLFLQEYSWFGLLAWPHVLPFPYSTVSALIHPSSTKNSSTAMRRRTCAQSTWRVCVKW